MDQNNVLHSTGNNAEGEGDKNDTSTSSNTEPTVPKHSTLGSGPSGPIPDGGNSDEEKQPKESTGNDSTMGGADGGIAGMGYSKETTAETEE